MLNGSQWPPEALMPGRRLMTAGTLTAATSGSLFFENRCSLLAFGRVCVNNSLSARKLPAPLLLQP